jgi:hypothetical protein
VKKIKKNLQSKEKNIIKKIKNKEQKQNSV